MALKFTIERMPNPCAPPPTCPKNKLAERY